MIQVAKEAEVSTKTKTERDHSMSDCNKEFKKIQTDLLTLE